MRLPTSMACLPLYEFPGLRIHPVLGPYEIEVGTKHPRHWDDLKGEASDASGSGLPELIRENPFFALLFIIVYPHRTNAAILRWLNAKLKKAVYRFED